jgi:hypothetical protein
MRSRLYIAPRSRLVQIRGSVPLPLWSMCDRHVDASAWFLRAWHGRWYRPEFSRWRDSVHHKRGIDTPD